MFNKEFLKTLTILYAEDDATIRTSLGNILNKVFKKVIICEDGQDGVDKYNEYSKTIEFDAIISDINMPNLNGLEMVKDIRRTNSEIPVIMTTAHGEANYLMEAIKVNVSGYTLKPVDTKELLLTIQKFCEIKKNQRLIIQKEAELSEYMDLINTLATICKVDANGNITEINDFFKDIVEYEEDELLNNSIENILHEDCINTSYKKMKEVVAKGQTWKGKLKLNTKSNEKIHLRITSISKKDHDTAEVIGYISIGFLADDEEEEKAQTMHQVRLNMLEQKQKVLALKKEIKILRQNQANPLDNQLAANEKILKQALNSQKNQNQDLVKQISYYEDELSGSNGKLQNMLSHERARYTDLSKKSKKQAEEIYKLKENLIAAKSMISASKPRPKYVE